MPAGGALAWRASARVTLAKSLLFVPNPAGLTLVRAPKPNPNPDTDTDTDTNPNLNPTALYLQCGTDDHVLHHSRLPHTFRVKARAKVCDGYRYLLKRVIICVAVCVLMHVTMCVLMHVTDADPVPNLKYNPNTDRDPNPHLVQPQSGSVSTGRVRVS